jgi:uncharacterized protein with PIN domain
MLTGPRHCEVARLFDRLAAETLTASITQSAPVKFLSQIGAMAPRVRNIQDIFVRGGAMQAVAAIRTTSADSDFDGSACPKCGTLIAEPKSSDYRGLGRIEHSWHCKSCGDNFRTKAHMAGVVEFDPENLSVAAA